MPDTTAIIQLINLYGAAVDTQCWALFDRIFAPDMEADFSAAAHWHDLASFKRDFAAFHDPFDSTQHAMSNHLVHVAGDEAFAFSYGNWRLVRQATDGDPLWQGTGWYDDFLIRRPDGWRIKKRVCRVVGWSGNPFVNETLPGVKFSLQTHVLRREVAAGRVGFFEVTKG